VYGAALLGLPANWITALVWAVVLTGLALLMMTTIGVMHPAMRAHRQDDPGPAATHFGAMTPMGSLMGHLVYGLVLGLGYSLWPLG
jgi:branched-subunit amino acid ABC-type transport system permease component